MGADIGETISLLERDPEENVQDYEQSGNTSVSGSIGTQIAMH